jgi:UrcA family protein
VASFENPINEDPTMNKHFRTAFFGLAVAAAAAASTPRVALAAADGLPARTVSYADLDLTKPSGAQALYRRISVAAQQVCTIAGYRDLQEKVNEQRCVAQAIDAAVRDVQSAALNEQHDKHSTRVARN